MNELFINQLDLELAYEHTIYMILQIIKQNITN